MEGIAHLFPFCQQLIQELSISGSGAVKEEHGACMDPAQELFESFFFVRLFILIPFHIVPKGWHMRRANRVLFIICLALMELLLLLSLTMKK